MVNNKKYFYRSKDFYTKREYAVYCLLRTIATLRKGNVNFVVSVRQHGSIRLSLDGFP